jgi:hypothetical protein|nr:MAG TPA: hypothetical protein [Caudoviricetes sp.]
MISEYICEKCKTKYKTKEEAMNCSMSHLGADDLKVLEAMTIYKSDVFPSIVTLVTKDGRNQVYQKCEG